MQIINRATENINRMPYLAAVPFFTAGFYIGYKFWCTDTFCIYLRMSVLIFFLAGGFICYFAEIHFTEQHFGKHAFAKLCLANNCIMAMFLLAFFMLGQCTAGSYHNYQVKNIFHLLEDGLLACDTVQAEGRISSHPIYKYGSLNFTIEVNRLSLKVRQKDLLAINGLKDTIEVEVRGAQNGWFQRDDYIWLQGIVKFSGNGRIVSPDSSENTSPILRTDSCNIKTIENPSLMQKVYDLRHRIYNCLSFTYENNLEWAAAAVAEALILGDKNNIPDIILEDFKKSGLMHLLAVSGLHMTFFAMMIYYLFTGFTKGRGVSFLFVFTLAVSAIAYNFLLGGKASALRATIFIILVFAARSWGRPHDGRILLYFSFLILMVVCPGFFFDRGFWLSFSAMTGIIMINPLLCRAAASIPFFRKIKSSYVFRVFFISLSVQFMIFPQLLYWYSEATLAGIFLNILILPIFYIVLLILMVSSAAAVLHPSSGGAVIALSTPFFRIIFSAAGYGAALDFLVFKDISITPVLLAVYYIVLAAVVLTARYLLNSHS